MYSGTMITDMMTIAELQLKINALEAQCAEYARYPERMTLEAALDYAYSRTCSFEVLLTNDGICRTECGKPLNPGDRNSFCPKHADFFEE